MKNVLIFTVLAIFTFCSFAQGKHDGFEPQPVGAASALKATVGKSFSSGWVFINGKYIKPPYKVERYGTVLRINGQQITNSIVPWEEFVKTQSGVTVSKSEEAPSEEPVVEEEEEEEDDFGWGDDDEGSLDDLFNDEPTPKKSVAKPKKKKAPKPKKPKVTVSYSFDGEFVPNSQTKALVDKINTARARIDAELRKGGYFFFGSKYSSVNGDQAAANRIIPKLAEIMKQQKTKDSFVGAMRVAGLSFLPAPVINDLFNNRIDYFVLSERLKSEAENQKWKKLTL